MNLVLITSVINTPNKPLSYSKTRSLFNADERFNQTLKTLKTIKAKIPNCKLLIVECSETTENIKQIENLSDYFLNLYDKKEIKNDIFGISKSLGEGLMTINAIKYIINNKLQFNNLIKISGRYWLSDYFNYNNFNNNKIIVKKIKNDINNIFTGLYKLPYNIINIFLNYLEKNINNMKKCIGYEILFANFIKSINKSNVIFLNTIGLQGYVTICGSFYNG